MSPDEHVTITNLLPTHISEDSYTTLCGDGKTKSAAEQILLNTDIKEYSCSEELSEIISKKSGKVPAPLVLQIQKIRNVSAPTYHPESNAAPRMFCFTLTDGVASVRAIEIECINAVDFNTSPGSKMLIRSAITVNEGLALLTNSNCKYLGGRVTDMYEKWITAKNLMSMSQNRNQNKLDGPPPFVPFGKEVQANQVGAVTGKFKSLDIANTNTSTGSTEVDSSEFNAQRQASIKEAMKQGTATGSTKSFGGIKQSATNEPLERTQFSVKTQRKSKKSSAIDDKDPNISDDEDGGRGRRGRRRRGDRGDDSNDMLVNTKPSGGSNTLFDFLSEKISGETQQVSKQCDDSSHSATQQSNYHSQPSTGPPHRDQQHRMARAYDYHHNNTDRQAYSQRPHTAGNTQPPANRSQSYRGDRPPAERYHTAQDHQPPAMRPQNRQNHQPPASRPHTRLDQQLPAGRLHDRDDHQTPSKRPHSRYNEQLHSDNAHVKQRNQPSAGRPHGKQDHQPPANVPHARSNRQSGTVSDSSGSSSVVNVVRPAVGEVVMAKYWEDQRFYKFKISRYPRGPHPNSVVGVFIEYGNTEEVPLSDIKPAFQMGSQAKENSTNSHHTVQSSQPQSQNSAGRSGRNRGTLVFERSDKGQSR